MDSEFVLNGKTRQVALLKSADGLRLKVDDRESGATYVEFSPNCFLVGLDGGAETVYVAKDGDRTLVHVAGRVLELEAAESPRFRTPVQDGVVDGRQLVYAPMPGKIVKISVREGEKVRPKQTLCVVEAMKMENEIVSRLEGVVRSIHFEVEALVGTDAPIMVVEEAPASESEDPL